MTNPKAYIALVLIKVLSFSITVFGQHKSVEADSLFQNKIESIWEEIEQSENADSLLPIRSNYLYEYYMQHQGNPNGKYALEQAFLMWSHTGNNFVAHF